MHFCNWFIVVVSIGTAYCYSTVLFSVNIAKLFAFALCFVVATPFGAMNQSISFYLRCYSGQAAHSRQFTHCMIITSGNIQSGFTIMKKSFITKSFRRKRMANIVNQMKHFSHFKRTKAHNHPFRHSHAVLHRFVFRMGMQINELFVLIRFSFHCVLLLSLLY